MKKIIIDSYGKINLGLDILSKRPDGYHNISTIMQRIDLKDIITIEESEKFEIICDYEGHPQIEDDLIYKSYMKLKELKNIDRPVKINVEKSIPIGAGLAGGSSNGAATLVGLNEFWNLGYSREELMEIGKPLGADIPYCIRGGSVLAQGIGEKFTDIGDFSGVDIILIYPNIFISTEKVYQSIEENKMNRIDLSSSIYNMEERNFKGLRQTMKNIMEEPVFKQYPLLKSLKEDLLNMGSDLALMSGSGSTIFGVFTKNVDEKYEILKSKYPDYNIIKTKTI